MQRRKLLHLSLMVGSASLMAGCGFRLRGSVDVKFAFQTLFSGFPPNSGIGQEFKRQASIHGLSVIDDAATASTAQVVLRVLEERRDRVIVGSGVAGQVNAIQLRLRLKFSLFTTQGKSLLEEVEISQQREMSYSESAALSKESEEQALYNDMQSEIAQQLLRRLAAIKSL